MVVVCFNEFISKFDDFNDLILPFYSQFNVLSTSRTVREFQFLMKIHTAKLREAQAAQEVPVWEGLDLLVKEAAAEILEVLLQQQENN
jgi:hypothetical protein